MKALVLSLLVSTCLLSQNLYSDSVNIAELVKTQIVTGKLKGSGGTFSKSVSTETVHSPSSAPATRAVIPENIYLIIFFSLEFALGLGIYLVRKKMKKTAPLKTVKAEPLAVTFEKKKVVKNERQQLATYVKCQLALCKTKEELANEAKKLNVPVGELELAARLHNMTKGV